VIVLGASFDTQAENLAFAEAQGFPFRLLSDTDHSVAVAYEVARDRGDKFADFPRRLSYLIDPKGLIYRAYDVTDVARHADDVIADVERAVRSR
jgi:thioredoxin-dependent peroxiredoxin